MGPRLPRDFAMPALGEVSAAQSLGCATHEENGCLALRGLRNWSAGTASQVVMRHRPHPLPRSCSVVPGVRPSLLFFPPQAPPSLCLARSPGPVPTKPLLRLHLFSALCLWCPRSLLLLVARRCSRTGKHEALSHYLVQAGLELVDLLPKS